MPAITKYLPGIEPELARYRRWRHELHRIPELGFEERQTSDYVCQQLDSMGVQYSRGLADTGVLAWVQRGDSDKAIGLRCELDALPISEQSQADHASQHPGKMHACGHDGHMAMLLAGCDQINQHAVFDGTVYFIFQPAEEGGGGGERMVQEGLFQRHKMQGVYGLHNFPGMPVGQLSAVGGAVMASVDEFRARIRGRGGHAARPHVNVDPILAAAHAVCALQSIVSRNTDPNQPLVVSVTQLHAGTASNIIPEEARLVGTVRCLSEQVRDEAEAAIKRILPAVCAGLGAEVELDYKRLYPVTINDAEHSATCAQLVEDLLGSEGLSLDTAPSMGGEDFSYMLQVCPGCYAKIGNGSSADLHSEYYDFNDELLAPGAAYWRHLAESLLPAQA